MSARNHLESPKSVRFQAFFLVGVGGASYLVRAHPPWSGYVFEYPPVTTTDLQWPAFDAPFAALSEVAANAG